MLLIQAIQVWDIGIRKETNDFVVELEIFDLQEARPLNSIFYCFLPMSFLQLCQGAPTVQFFGIEENVR